MIKKTVLPSKLKQTKDLITPHAGLALLGEFAVGLGLLDALDNNLPAPGSGAGYLASEHVALHRMPSSDATGDWLRRSGLNTALEGFGKVNRNIL